jgi:hypothetical protein
MIAKQGPLGSDSIDLIDLFLSLAQGFRSSLTPLIFIESDPIDFIFIESDPIDFLDPIDILGSDSIDPIDFF